MRLELFDSNKLNFVELNTTGDNENYNRCDVSSKYIDTEVFNLFAYCFESSNNLYEYYDATKFNSRNIVPLRNELIKNREKMEVISSLDAFIDHIGNKFLGSEFLLKLENDDRTWQKNWESYLLKLIEVNKQLVMVVKDCIEYEKILWVIGY